MSLLSVISGVKGAVTGVLGGGAANRRGSSYAVTVITPIEKCRTKELKDVLHGFDLGERSPLHAVPDVHFARWVIIDGLRTDWAGAPKQPSSLKSDYLLFSADLTAPAIRAANLPLSFFRDLHRHMHYEAQAVWGMCRGFPGIDPVEGFVEYLHRSQIDIGLYYAAFPDATPDEIAHATQVRRELAAFALEHQNGLVDGTLDPAEFKKAYYAKDGIWCG